MARPDVFATGLTAGVLLAAATERLRRSGSPSPRLDAELLVSHALGRDRAWLLAHPDATLEPDDAAAIDGWVERRSAGEPIAYIRGFKEWFSLRVATDRRALIPRPETELLAECALAEIADRMVRDEATITAWDVATGSGAVALALALRFRTPLALGRLRLVASDLFADALELASENLAAHGVARHVTLACADLLEPAGGTLPLPDVVIANLPYVRSAEALGAGSLAHEPQVALDGGPDGLVVIRRLLSELPDRLAPGGVGLIEIGAGQARAVRAAIQQTGLRAAVTSFPDLAGVERVVRIARL
jgi:release factor glutamine methyltransferase